MKTNIFLLFLFCCFSSLPLSAQLLKGKITDRSGVPVSDATLYIREIALGITADENGEFQTSLKNGSYTFDFSSLGYERKTVSVQIGKPLTTLTVEMEKKLYALKEVIITANREDPAYAIMRKAISMAPFYLHQIKRYESEMYLKGTVKIDKIPGFAKINVGGKNIKNIKNKLFLVESQNEVTFTAPNKYEQKVIAFSSTVPADLDAGDAMSVMTTNIYDPKAFGRISPLAPGAFTYYRFTFEGMAAEGDHLINKIRVQPKMNNPKLVTGWLYIIENSWNVKSADLSATELGITIRFTATYNEVKPYAFLPTSYDMDMKVNLMGFKASGKYYSSVQYKNVEINEAQGVIRKKKKQPEPASVVVKPKTKKQQKAEQQLEALSSKEELSTREAYKMARLMKDASEPEEKRKENESLEIITGDSNIKVTVDSLAGKRDSLYWMAVRDLPLREEEIVSYQIKDSLKQQVDSLQSRDSLQNRSVGTWIGKLITGERFTFKKKYKFGYNGLIGACNQYNFVDGFWLGQRFAFSVDLDKHKSLTLSPSVYYTTARKAVNWQIDGTFGYAPMRNGSLSVSGGHTTTDYMDTDGTLYFINSLSSLFFGENPIKFYEKKFVEVKNKIDLANGLILNTGLTYERRNALSNRQSYNFFGNTPSSNIPHGRLLPMPDNTALNANIRLEYTPKYHYWKVKDKKMYAYSRYPTFFFEYEKGIPVRTANSSSFDRLEAGVSQSVRINAFNSFNYTVNAGKFLLSRHIYFPDYKHFNTNELFLTGNTLDTSFSLLDNYVYSTNKQWLQVYLNYPSSYLLFKRLPFLQSYMFNEALHARTLWIPGKNYTEFGYSVGFNDVARIGVFVGLDKGRYDAVGFTVSLPILKSMGIR